MIRRTNSYISSPLVFLIVLVLLTVWLDYITKSAEYIKNSESRSPDYMVENLIGVRTDHIQGIERQFSAQKLLHFYNEEITQLERVSFVNVDPEKPIMRISADQATVKNKGNDIDLFENITAIRESDNAKAKLTLTTDFLHLDPKASRVSTDHAVTISRFNSTIEAKGMTFDTRLGEVKLLSTVKAVHRK